MFRFKRSYLGESVYLNAPLFSISNYHHIVLHMPKSHMTETTMIGARLSFSVFSSSWKFPQALKKKVSHLCTGCLCVLCMAMSALPSRLCMSSMFWLSWTSLSMWKAAGQSTGRLCQRLKLWEQTPCKDKFTHAVNTTEHR